MQARKHVEDLFLILLVKSNSIVLYVNYMKPPAVFFGCVTRDLDEGRHGSFAVLDGITDQILEELLQLPTMTPL